MGNWMRKGISRYNHMMEPLLKVLEKVYKAADGRTKRGAQRVFLAEAGRSEAENTALAEMEPAMVQMVQLNHLDPTTVQFPTKKGVVFFIFEILIDDALPSNTLVSLPKRKYGHSNSGN